jgi:hypothetical protein
VTPACDVYALGTLLYVCLTGSVPFDAATPLGVLTRHLTDEPQLPTARVPALGLSPTFERIVMMALEKEPARRYPSASALQAALVEELRGGLGSVEHLLDSQRLQGLAGSEDAATRDEVERYERKLRRRSWATWSVAAAVAAAGVFGAARFARSLAQPAEFQGDEFEPNNAASEARVLPFPLDVRGHLGKRLDRQRGDRDFFRVTLPAGVAAFHLALEPLPNLATCVWLYPPDSTEPFGRYCAGTPGQGLEIPALRLAAGGWLVAVMQDRDQYLETGPPPVYENVSDDYRLRLEPSQTPREREVEPNDAAPLGNVIAPGAVLRGALSWARDVDLVCAGPAKARVRFVLEDAVEHPRNHYSVLEATARGGPESGVPVRVHRAGAPVKGSSRDVAGVYRGPWLVVDPAAPPCVELALTANPWGPTPPALVPIPGPEEYLVRLEAE